MILLLLLRSKSAGINVIIILSQCFRISPPFLFLKYWNKKVAASNVIAKPISREEIKVNGLVRSIKTEVNWSIGKYSSANTTRRSISDIAVTLPLNQLLRRVPTKMVAIPIHNSVMVP